MSTNSLSIDGYMVRGTEKRAATITWAEPVDEPPTVVIDGFDDRRLYLEVWRAQGWDWQDAEPENALVTDPAKEN